MARVELLVLDDWGLSVLTQPEREDLLEILEDRHGLRSTLITSQLPMDHWHELITNSTVADAPAVLQKLRAKYADASILELDGLSFEYPTWWFNVRSSNTEPLVRLNLEAKTQAEMEKKRDEVLALIRG